MSTKFKIPKGSQLSDFGKCWEYYHFLIEFTPVIYKYCNTIENVSLYVPKLSDNKFELNKKVNSDKRVGYVKGTMEHIFQEIFDLRITIIPIDPDKISEIECAIIPFPKDKFKWSSNNKSIYLLFQKYLYNKFNIYSTLKYLDKKTSISIKAVKNILIIKRGIQKGCVGSGTERRQLPDKFFNDAIAYFNEKKKGNIFKIVVLDNMDFKEQIRLFYDAHIIIGIHGAGLSNILFSKPNSIVFEVGKREHWWPPCYKNLCEKMDLIYNKSPSNSFNDLIPELNPIINL